MMDPNIGWSQTENKGPALTLWMKLWKDFNVGNKDENYSKIIAQLYKRLNDNPSSTYDLENNQHLISKHNGIPWRKSKDSQYEGIDGLHQEIEDFYEYMKPKPKEYDIRVGVQTRITQIIENLWPDAVVECFGSFKTNTFLSTSDIDLVVINHRWTFLPLAQLEQHFLVTGQCLPTQIRVLDRAAVPIIKMTDIYTDIRINISFNMPQVVKSVNLVNEYLKEFPNATKLLLVIKQFVLQRDFNEVFRGGLSSYSLVLMVVHFFKTNPDTQVEPKKSNLGNLLMRFLEIYGRKLNYEMVGLKIKDGIFAKKTEMLAHMQNGHDPRHKPSKLCIEDPLDQNNNVSKNSYNVEKIRDAFSYAFEILNKAVGPHQPIVGKTETILGRIVRITDEVVDKREHLLRAYGNMRLVSYGSHYANPQRMLRGNNRNRGNRGNKRYNNNNWNRNNNQHRALHQNSQQTQTQTQPQPQPQPNDYSPAENSQQSNGQTRRRLYPITGRQRNGFKRSEFNDGHNGSYNHPPIRNNYKFPQNDPRYNVCYYSFDRNPNQHRERAQLQEEQINKTAVNGVKDHISEVNGTTDIGPLPESKQRHRSNTCD